AQLTRVQQLDEQLLDLADIEPGVGHRARRGRRFGQARPVGRRDDGDVAHFCATAIGTRTCTNLIAAGPIVTTQIAGKIQKPRGNTILTPVFAAASSARCRRLVRSTAECTRSDCATLVPNLSVWISIAASDVKSSTPVRSARLRSASDRALPARISRLTSRNSSD